ncbi:hypothetical protein [Capnocytophaga sputigena]|uniref:hypothetical protein n=1 Tax=Capnocytophaga sputigena TaxID=1019 RepID=UPI00241C578C
MIYYILLSLGVAVLLYLLVMQGIANLKREKVIEELREKWHNALVDEKRTKETIMELIGKTFGEATVSSIEKGIYKENMPDYLVKMAIGRPLNVQPVVFHGITTERWRYKSVVLSFQNGRLIGWETSDNSTQKAGL